MKRLLAVILLVAMFTSCRAQDETPGTAVPSPSEESDTASVEESSVAQAESFPDPEEIYLFLSSPYVVTSAVDAYGKSYLWNYYFVEGLVAGAKLETTFTDRTAAKEYYEQILEDYPDARRRGATVTHYMTGKMLSYYRYTLDKLKFVLEKAGYAYIVNFDEESFEAEFSAEED